jgi:RNA polymerase sigma factor (sigma-70 family)
VPRLAFDDALTVSAERAPEQLALDEALDELAEQAPDQARIVELRFFAGLKHEEIAELLGGSVSTVYRGWRTARAWLYRRLSGRDARGP